MSASAWTSRSFVYEARAGRGEEVTRWAIEVEGRFRPISMLPTKEARRSEQLPYRGESQLKGPEGSPCLFDDTRQPGQIWEKRVEVTAPAGSRVRKRTVRTEQPAHLKDPWDYIEAGVIEPQRRYHDEFFVLCKGGNLMREARYLRLKARGAQRQQPLAAVGSGPQLVGREAAAAARELLRRLG